MRFTRLAAAAAAAVSLAASAAALAPDTPLITDGKIKVDALDFEAFLLRIPEDRRGEVRIAYDRIATVVDSVYVTRVFAERAREAGLDQDPIAQRRLRQVQETFLADLYSRKLEKEAVPAVLNLEPRARELYRADPAKFTSPELVHVQHILVDLNGRTKQAALERAQKVYEQAKAGEDFLVLATRYSDANKDRRGNAAGDLGWNEPRAFMPPVQKAIAAMNAKGEISPPVESDAGYHVVRFIERKAPQLAKYDEVKDKIIAEEKARLQKQRIEAAISEVRASPSVVIHKENVEKIVVPLDPEMMKRAAEAAEKK